MDSTYWIRYSDYTTVKDERGMDCIKPAVNAVPVAYNVAGKLGDNVAELINIVLGEKYAGVFSPEYSEKAANISAWLDWISVQYNRAQVIRNGRMSDEPFVSITLQTMLESASKRLLSEKAIRTCPVCHKVFYNPDTAAETCGDDCQRVYDNIKHLQWMKENFHSAPISGG